MGAKQFFYLLISLKQFLLIFFYFYRTKTNYTLNKAISYILILSLFIAEKCTLNFDRLIQATNESRSRILNLTYALPIRHKRETNEICLKLPSQILEKKAFIRRR